MLSGITFYLNKSTTTINIGLNLLNISCLIIYSRALRKTERILIEKVKIVVLSTVSKISFADVK